MNILTKGPTEKQSNRAVNPEKAWAARILHVRPESQPGDVRAAFLRAINIDLAPAEAVLDAANLLIGTALPLTPNAQADRTARFRAEVEAFAVEFWSLRLDERSKKCSNLLARCKDETIRRRLMRLQRGLYNEANPTHSLAEETATAIKEIFILRPREKAVYCAIWLADQTDRNTELTAVIHQLRRENPSLAKLEPELLRRVTSGVRLCGVPPIDEQILEEEERRKLAEQEGLAQMQSQVNQKTKKERFEHTAILVVLFVVTMGGIFGFLTRSSRPTPHPCILLLLILSLSHQSRSRCSNNMKKTQKRCPNLEAMPRIGYPPGGNWTSPPQTPRNLRSPRVSHEYLEAGSGFFRSPDCSIRKPRKGLGGGYLAHSARPTGRRCAYRIPPGYQRRSRAGGSSS